MMALLFMNLGGGGVVCCMGVFLLRCCWVSKIQERTCLSLLVGFEAGLVCVCAADFLTPIEMENGHFLRWVLDLVGTSQVLGNSLTSKQAKKKRRMLKKHEHQTEDR